MGPFDRRQQRLHRLIAAAIAAEFSTDGRHKSGCCNQIAAAGPNVVAGNAPIRR
jgi:hypothetical protein